MNDQISLRTNSIVLEVDRSRFFSGIKKGRLQTAWCLSGAKLFMPMKHIEKEIADAEIAIKKRGRHSRRMVVRIEPYFPVTNGDKR